MQLPTKCSAGELGPASPLAWLPCHSTVLAQPPAEDFSEEVVAAQLASAREAGADLRIVFIHWQALQSVPFCYHLLMLVHGIELCLVASPG